METFLIILLFIIVSVQQSKIDKLWYYHKHNVDKHGKEP